MVEIFPSYYFRNENKASKLEGYSVQQINRGLELLKQTVFQVRLNYWP